MKCYGVIGYPVAHSLSPVMHGAAFDALGIDAQYSAYEIPPKGLTRCVRGLVRAGLRGFNVTVPHKQALARMVDELHASAQVLGAVNTVLVRNERLVGYNTDGVGFRNALVELGWRPSKQSRALLLGAGGSARAVLWQLANSPKAEVVVANRTLSRAKELARWLRKAKPGARVAARGLDALNDERFQLIVNTTSVGMKAKDDRLLVPASALEGSVLVYDLVYNRETALLKAARAKGCIAAGGLSMLLYQGAESFRIWLRRKPPVEAMRAALQRPSFVD